MPELPEVETVRRGLDRTVKGGTITECVVANSKVLLGQSPEILRERIVGCRIEQVDRRGKYLLVRLSSPNSSPESLSICLHLKMRGHIAVELEASVPGKYHCVSFRVQTGNGESVWVRFYDAWTWGELRALYTQEMLLAAPSLATMGPEPLTEEWNGDILQMSLRGRRTAIKPTLLDQKVVAGVGNIYADEALFQARIHPERLAGSLTLDEGNRLAEAIKKVLTEAIVEGGTASDNFFNVAGNAGRYVPQVYERGGQPCSICGAPLTRIRLAGRSSVFCDACQPLMR